MDAWTLLPVAVVTTVAVTLLLCLLVINFASAERRLRRSPQRLYTLQDPDFRRATGVLLGPAILSGNQVQPLANGDAIFPPMLRAIESARVSVCFETFIYWSGDIGERFASALLAAATRGVAVHLVLDWIGSRELQPALLTRFRKAGIEVHLYHRLSWLHLGRLNNRTHRKLLIVDGVLGFTGGVGIGTQWTGNAQDAAHWRDMHYAVTGPVVAQMQAVFLDNWIKVSGNVLHSTAYFPPLEACGDMDAQMFGSSPSGGAESMQLMFLLAITAARRSIDIASPYFVPDRLTRETLVAAAQRGILVRVLVPGRRTDNTFARRASQRHWGRLLRAGVAIFEFVPTMMHSKFMVVDGEWTTVGSANFDNRSFRLNDEANLNVFSIALAEQHATLFEADLARSRRVSYVAWKNRSLWRRMRESVVSVVESQL
jgi:cardiolipin synthase A/B